MSIKRTIITTATIVVAVAMVASVVGAQTPSIASLMQEIAALQAQLQSLSGSTTTTTTSGSLPAACVGVTFTRNLTVGSVGSDVKCLQALLNTSASTQVATTGAGSPGYETSTFGPKTLAAVKIYQAQQGFTPANQVGPLTRAKLNAWLSGSSSTTTTTTTTNGQTTQTGTISAMLASDTPAAGAIIASEATADLLHINFVGTGTVTSVTLQRSGISDQNTLTNVYLFDGNTRITDGYSFNINGQIVMNGLNIAVNGSHEISVRADTEASSAFISTSSSIAIAMTGYTANGQTLSSNVQGNIFMCVTGSAATASLTANTVAAVGSSTSGGINGGTTQYIFWSAPLQVNTRAILLKGANFQVIGSAPTNALTNVELYIDGVATTNSGEVVAINGSTYVSFNFASAPITLTTGSHTVDVRADVTGGANRSIELSLALSSDITLTDPQVGVNIALSGTVPNNAGTIWIATGSATTSVESAFAAQTNIPGSATNVVIGRFTMMGYGENVKVNTLEVQPWITSPTGPSCTTATVSSGTVSAGGTCTLNNVTLYFNGSQIGSQQTYNGASANNGLMTFTLGSQMVIEAGQTNTLEIRADLVNSSGTGYTGGTIGVTLPVNGSTYNYQNGQGQTSQNLVTVPAGQVYTNGLSIQSGLLTVAKNTAFANQSVAPNTTGARIGSFVIQNQSTSESIRLTTLKVLVGTDATGTAPLGTTTYITDLSALRTSDTTGGSNPIQPSGNDTFSVNDVLAPSQQITVDVFANVGSKSSGGSEYFQTGLQVSGIGSVDNTSTTTPSTASNNYTITSGSYAVYGQVMTVGTGTLQTPYIVSSSTTPTQYISVGNNGATNSSQATFNFTSTSGNASINTLKFLVSDSSALTGNLSGATVTNVCVTPVGSSTPVCGAPQSGIVTLNFTPGLAVPNGGAGLYQNVQVSYAGVNTSGASGTVIPGSLSTLKLAYIQSQSGSTTTTTCDQSDLGTTACPSTANNTAMSPVAAPTVALVGSAPIVTVSTTPVSFTNNATDQIGQVTIAAGAQGAIKVRQLVFNVAASGFTASTVSFTNLQLYANNAPLASSSIGCSMTSFTASSNSGVVTCVVPAASYNNDYPIAQSGSVNFGLFATVGGTETGSVVHSVSATLVGSTSFLWDDTATSGAYNGGSLTAAPAVGPGSAPFANAADNIYNFPTGSFVAQD